MGFHSPPLFFPLDIKNIPNSQDCSLQELKFVDAQLPVITYQHSHDM